MGSSTEAQMRENLTASTGQDSSWMTLGMITDQRAALAEDVRRVKSHPLIPDSVVVGGFIYDVDTGLLEAVC
jgi:carbonic anhydrase